MFIEKGFYAKHEFWRYVLGCIAVVVAMTIGQIPWTIAVFIKEGMDVAQKTSAELMGVLEPNLNLFLLLFSFLVSLAALFIIIKFLHQQKIKDVTTTRKKIDWGRIFFGFGLIFILTLLLTGFDYYFNPENYLLNFDLVPFLILCFIAIALIPIQTSLEEYVFRGYLMQGLGTASIKRYFPLAVLYVLFVLISYFFVAPFFEFGLLFNMIAMLVYGLILILLFTTNIPQNFYNTSLHRFLHQILSRKSTPLFITSVVFGAMHFFNPEVDKIGNIIMIYYIGTGFFLGIITLMDEGMELALGFHAGNNLVTALLVTADWTVLQTHSILKDISEPSVGFVAVLPTLIFFGVFLFIMRWKYKWSNWKEKLFGKITPPPTSGFLDKV